MVGFFQTLTAQRFESHMLILGTLPRLQSILVSIWSRCSILLSRSILAPLAARFAPSLPQGAPNRGLAMLVLFSRLSNVAALNEGDSACAVMNALLDHCEHFPDVDLDDAICRDLRWILGRNKDVSILCGHVRILISDKNSEHADKVIKMLKRIVMS